MAIAPAKVAVKKVAVKKVKPKGTITREHAADLQKIANKMAALATKHEFCDVFATGVRELNAEMVGTLTAKVPRKVKVSAWVEREFDLAEAPTDWRMTLAVQSTLRAEYAAKFGVKPHDISVSF